MSKSVSARDVKWELQIKVLKAFKETKVAEMSVAVEAPEMITVFAVEIVHVSWYVSTDSRWNITWKIWAVG